MAEKTSDLEFIAGDPSNVLNVYKALMSCTTEMRKGSDQAKILANIYKKINDSLDVENKNLKDLRVINLEIESVLKRLDKLDTIKLERARELKWTTSQISKANKELAALMEKQASTQKQITDDNNKKAGLEKIKVGWINAANQLLSKQFGSLSETLGAWTETGSKAFVVFTVLKQIVQIFDQLDTAAFEFRQEMGFTRNYTGDIDKFARAGATNMAQLSVTGKKMYEAAAGISKELFSSANVTQEMMNNVALISTQLGVSAQATSELVKNLGIVSRSAASTQQDTLFFAASLSEAAGTPLADVMNDISNATKNAYQFISRSSITMVKAAIEAKRMGTSITSAAQSSEFLLKFTSSVNAEMEASVLLGKSINLQKARELAYHRDIRGLNAEILRIIKETNFENLDPFQQNAVAVALGKSTGELAQMAQAERERLNMVKAMTPEQKKQYDMYQEMMAGGDKQKKDYAEIAKTQLMQLSNQTRLTAISASWNKIMMQLAKAFLPIIDVTLKFIADHFDLILRTSSGLYGLLVVFPTVFKSIAVYSRLISMTLSSWGRASNFGWLKAGWQIFSNFFKFASKGFLFVSNSITKVMGPVSKMFGWIAKIFSAIKPLVGFAGALGKWLTPIGWIITAIIFIVNLFKRFEGITKNLDGTWKGLGKTILKGFAAIGLALYDTLIKPFVDVFKWIMNLFGGHSPSKIGLSIVKGIFGIQGMMIKALFFPYIKAWELIKKIPFVSHLFGGKNVGASVIPEGKPAMTVEKPTTDMATRKSAEMPAAVSGMNDELTKRMSDIVDAINGLREDMKNGKLTANVYIDSQKLDAAVGRRIAYTGQLT